MTAAIRINLLDWRQARVEARQKAFIKYLIIMPALALLAFGALPSLYYSHATLQQAQRNQFLQQYINHINGKLTEINKIKISINEIKQKFKVVSGLRQTQVSLAGYLEQLALTIPEGVRLTQLQHEDDRNLFKGVARSSNRVSAYVSGLSSSAWFFAPHVSLLESGHHDQILFSLQVRSVQPGHENATENTARPGGST